MRGYWTKRGRAISRQEVEIFPEEIFPDAVNVPGFRPELHEGRIERPLGRTAMAAFVVLLALGSLAAAGRLVELQVFRGEELRLVAKANRTYPITIAAPRGVFYDRNFALLVENAPTFVIGVRTQALPSDAAFGATIEAVARLTGRTPAEIAEANDLAGVPSSRAEWPAEVFVAAGDLRAIVIEIQARPDAFPGVTVTEASRRRYVSPQAAAHLLGFVGLPDRANLADRFDLRPGEFVGKSGLELTYGELLRGAPGEKLIEVNAVGKPQRERFVIKAEAGRDLLLEVDGRLQEFAAATLARHIRALGKRAGAIVAIDPRDGAVRALVSHPSYDPNRFGRPEARRELARLLADPADPFFNRAVSGGYPSASTIKPFLAVAALEEGIIDPLRNIYDPGFISVPNPYDPERPSIFKDWKALGYVDMRRAIALSANVYFYTIGGGHGGIPGLGITKIKDYLTRFGWGSRLGIDLPGEASGLVPDPETKKLTRPHDPTWRLGDTYITAIGQGDLQVTPLQLAAATAAIANGGTLWKPRIARAVIDDERRAIRTFTPEVLRAGLARAESLAVVREGMRQAVTQGSAIGLAGLPVAAAGKTGTAQTGVYGRNHGWFAGFAPYDDPEIVIVVLVEEGTGGSTDAVPIAREVLYHYFTQARNSPLTDQ